jgi:hypothetical protein
MTTLQRFQSILREYCDEQRGRRAELARAIFADSWKARMTDVTDWISGKQEPKGERMLDILAWLPAAERAKVFRK